MTRVAEIIAPRYPDATAGRAPVDRVRLAGPPRRAPPAAARAPRRAGDELDLRAQSGATAFPADLLDALREADLSPLAPKAVLYVHLHEAAIHGAAAAWPGSRASARVTLTGLADAARPDRADGEAGARPVRPGPDHRLRAPRVPQGTRPPDHRRRLLALRHLDRRNVDYDHPIPYDDTGPPGQTGTHNSGPLGRRHHRYKTHAGYRSRQCGQGSYVWLTPHGLGYLVDHRGTRRISNKHARMILDAPPGVDIYPA